MTRHFQREMFTAVGLSATVTALMVGLGAIGAGLLAFTGWHGGFGVSGATPTLELRAPAAPAPARPVAHAPHRTTIAASAPRAAARPRRGVVPAAPTRRHTGARLARRGHVVRHVASKPTPAVAAPVVSPRPVAAPARPASPVVAPAANPRGRTATGGGTHASGRSPGRGGRSHGDRHVAAGRNGHSHGGRHAAGERHDTPAAQGRVNAAGRNGRPHGDRHAPGRVNAAGGNGGERHAAAAPHGRVDPARGNGRSHVATGPRGHGPRADGPHAPAGGGRGAAPSPGGGHGGTDRGHHH